MRFRICFISQFKTPIVSRGRFVKTWPPSHNIPLSFPNSSTEHFNAVIPDTQQFSQWTKSPQNSKISCERISEACFYPCCCACWCINKGHGLKQRDVFSLLITETIAHSSLRLYWNNTLWIPAQSHTLHSQAKNHRIPFSAANDEC